MGALLTIEDIAHMWGISRRYARDVLVKTPGFPPPASGSTPKLRRWARDDVVAYIHRQPAGIPQQASKYA